MRPAVPRGLSSSKGAEFECFALDARRVTVAGDFNGWNPDALPMRKNRNGVWKVFLALAPGRYAYRFVVDGIWQNDPHALVQLPNPFGGWNSVVTVS